MAELRLIELDTFPFELLSKLGERESWRKEVHRPVYYLHKWWAKRLGSVFRGILLGASLDGDGDLKHEFYRTHSASSLRVFDPFMGGGTTVGEAHKLGMTAYGRDINAVAVDAVAVELGPLSRERIQRAFDELDAGVGEEIRRLYRSRDADGQPADVLYHFWVMTAPCPTCASAVDLFSSFVFARNAYPNRKPEVQIVCPECDLIFEALHGAQSVKCPAGHRFDPESGNVRGHCARCRSCTTEFKVIDAIGGRRPEYRHYAKLVLRLDGRKQYVAASRGDASDYLLCSKTLKRFAGETPGLALEPGFNTRQAIGYGFRNWRDFFNDRQLLALAMLRHAILELPDPAARAALFTLFSGTLEFNNLFASYKGEGTGAVRHMFAHHILKPERTPIEANVWGTPKSSGSFSNLYRSRLLRAIEYREAPTEVALEGDAARPVCSLPFTGSVSPWQANLAPRAVALSCGDSSSTGLPERSVDLVVTDPPFFDNVHYSELADFFRAWAPGDASRSTTRRPGEVQDGDADRFAAKLQGVFAECRRILVDGGLLAFTYHHSRSEGWSAVAHAVLESGFAVVNAHPVKSEMSVATPKSQAKDPIQLDVILVCRKREEAGTAPTRKEAVERAVAKIERLRRAGFVLSRNDCRVALHGQLLAACRSVTDAQELEGLVESALDSVAKRAPAANLDSAQM